jgi:hypothetical protein
MIRSRKVLAVSLLVAMVTGLAGCGAMTTAPVPDSSSSVATVDPASSGTATVHSTGSISTSTNSLLGTVGTLFGTVIGLVVKVLNVIGSIGGSLTNGRWRIDIPANAIDGTATVALGVRSSTSADCQLEISPADKNHFSVPVRLTADCRSVPSSELAGYVIFWFDPATGKWVPVEGSQVDLVNKTVSAPLLHFSKYSVGPADGKAGW